MQMNVPQSSQGYPSDARSSLLQDRQIIASRSRRIWRACAIGSRGARGRDSKDKSRVAQSISRGTFDNALRALKPGCESVGACLVPAVWYGGKPPLLAPTLETEPTVAVFACDIEVSPKRVPSPLRGDSPIGNAFMGGSRHRPAGLGAAISPASLGSGWRHQPHFPPPARRIDKGPITHPPSYPAILA
jgi:hypothetical protein